MKKWNRVLAILLAAGLTAGLCGCGDSAAEASSPVSVPASQAVPDVPTPEPTPEPTPTPEPGLHGLIYMDFIYSMNRFYLYCLNPETGDVEQLAYFHYNRPEGQSYYCGAFSLSGACIDRTMFSDDFTQIVCTTWPKNRMGWIDMDGNFFDASAALGDPHWFSPIGFTDGYFGFSDYIGGVYNMKYYYVPLDNFTPEAIQEGDIRTFGHPYDEDGNITINDHTYLPHEVTSWIDDTRCIVNFRDAGVPEKSLIVDVATRTQSEYIPYISEEIVTTWDGVISPDKSKIAFLSSEGYHYQNPAIYVISIDGGTPIKVPVTLPLPTNTLGTKIFPSLLGWI